MTGSNDDPRNSSTLEKLFTYRCIEFVIDGQEVNTYT